MYYINKMKSKYFHLKLYNKISDTTEGKLVFSLPSFPAALVVNFFYKKTFYSVYGFIRLNVTSIIYQL